MDAVSTVGWVVLVVVFVGVAAIASGRS